MTWFKHFLESSLSPESFLGLIIALGILVIIAILLIIGRRFESALNLERLGIPISILFGLFALLIGPHGPSPLLPELITDTFIRLPSPLLTLVFATLMLGRPIPKASGIWQPVASQALLALLLGFGQYLVGGVAVLLILIPFLGVDPLMGCLIEVGFEGGHGAASVMGQSFEKIGFSQGLDLGLAMATVGLLASTLLGSGLVVIGKGFGWINNEEDKIINRVVSEEKFSICEKVSQLLLNLGFAGLAVLFGITLLSLIKLIGLFIGGTFYEVISVFPVFPLALLGSLFIRFLLEKVEKTEFVSEILQREIGILSTDLLITTAMAGLNLPLLLKDWKPLTILALSGLLWNLLGMFFFSRIIFRKQWFERSIIEFGNATGVAASGILLLRLADPRDQTNTLPIFSIKQLFVQPLLSGGVITVIAPLAIMKFGLTGWTAFCGIMTAIFVVIAFLVLNKLDDQLV
ncbi:MULTISPECIES: sodium/glutamate symporter [Prochlorococcus]|uniref:Na+/glutamate symporter n=1 Tax=Prochlorococcus marinus (strain SARG / CCMP1375 / SS120) TaxID=167539 RepID=Q7VCF6_PROMA|nr:MULTISPECIES: sodium:solute symporter [Prochlorococcus]AAP99828.1 Na+/glutamate symporter [Prochlorococcus marinus subsp. marinus str. CCMP1375]KGG11825.1 putative sodium:solute symporter [Prochlorococcus marinus str. LG]KGG21868.1 putative sodium:solute symporter [Prochlorococcus marinus str. SS2]KGG23701.1 putative sodium:solute symporter [Prochlorococcus marinus str. SS35]KGG32063.1 putative sodium:solute symporter [Prochlorococcus marinus str. SS51]